MPTDDGVRLHEHERRTPVGPRSREQGPEPPIANAEPRPRTAPLVDGELLPQGEVFEDEGRLRPEGPSEATEEQSEIEHGRCPPDSRRVASGPYLSARMEFCRPTPPPPMITTPSYFAIYERARGRHCYYCAVAGRLAA